MSSFDADALIDAMLPLLGLELPEQSRIAVRLHLNLAAEHAAKLLGPPLDDHEDPAPVFVP